MSRDVCYLSAFGGKAEANDLRQKTMAKPTTKLNAQDRVILFCAATGIDTR